MRKDGIQSASCRGTSAVALVLAGCLFLPISATAAPATDSTRLATVRAFADHVLEKGRDRWSGKKTPLLADGINVDTGEPVVWRYRNREYIIHNLASQQNLFRVLTALTELTGEERYKNAALSAVRYHFDRLAASCGLLRWGGHQFIDLRTLQPVGGFDANCHEFKNSFPYYDLMREAKPEATARFLRAFWNAHILDWRTLDMNRHGAYGRRLGKLWDSDFGNPEPFFEGRGLTFINCGTDLIYAGATLFRFTGEEGALHWAERLAHQYVRARHPETGLGVYQYSKPRREQSPPSPMTTMRHTWSRYGDRAENQFRAEFGDVAREGWVLWGYQVRSIYARNALVQLSVAEQLGADKGQSILDWTVAGMKALLRHAYKSEPNHFRPMWADGTDMTGYVIRSFGYYNPTRGEQAVRPLSADPAFLVSYARAWRLARDPELWTAVRHMARGNGLGDPGATPKAEPAWNMDTTHANPETVFALLEIHRGAPHAATLDLAKRLADNMVAKRVHGGFFLPSPFHIYANFNAEEPLAILAVEAAARGQPEAVPEYVASRGYIHGEYDGHGRTYDRQAIWDQVRSMRLELDGRAYHGRQRGAPFPKDGYYRFDGQRDAVSWDHAPTAFEDNDQFSIAIRARMFDDNRFLCAYRYHLSRAAFRTRGRNPLEVQLGIRDADPRVIVIVYDGQAGDGQRVLRAYVDGKLAGTASGTGSPLSSYNARALAVGRTEHSGGAHAHTRVQDGIRLYRRVLSGREIADLSRMLAEAAP